MHCANKRRLVRGSRDTFYSVIHIELLRTGWVIQIHILLEEFVHFMVVLDKYRFRRQETYANDQIGEN